MNDTKQGHDEPRSFTPLIGFAIGAVVGGVVALLLAPASGERTRRRLRHAARRLQHDARHTLNEVRETATELGADVKSAVHAGREAFRHESDSLSIHGNSRTEQMPSTKAP